MGQQTLENLDGNGLGNLRCTGNGTIAICKFQIYGRSYEQTFGYSKYGWTSRSSSYFAKQ